MRGAKNPREQCYTKIDPSSNENEPAKRIRLTVENINQWPKFEKLLNDNKIEFDNAGRLRYLHGAPVGDLILTKLNKNNKPILSGISR
jgi:hypothetical protein